MWSRGDRHLGDRIECRVEMTVVMKERFREEIEERGKQLEINHSGIYEFNEEKNGMW